MSGREPPKLEGLAKAWTPSKPGEVEEVPLGLGCKPEAPRPREQPGVKGRGREPQLTKGQWLAWSAEREPLGRGMSPRGPLQGEEPRQREGLGREQG